MIKNYQKPQLEIISFDFGDSMTNIIAVSGGYDEDTEAGGVN